MSGLGELRRSNAFTRVARNLSVPLALSFFAGVLQAQTDVDVPMIPETLPLSARNKLAAIRTPLIASLKAHNLWVDKFMPNCGRIKADETERIAACGKEYQLIFADSVALVNRKTQFSAQLDSSIAADAGCAAIATRLERDKEALRRQQRTNEMGLAEIDAWRRANEEAMKEAAIDGAKYSISLVATALEKREGAARAYKGWLTRYAKQMKQNHVPFEVLQGKIESAMHGYVNARLQIAGGTVLARGLEAQEIFENFRTQAGLVARDAGESDAAMKAALNDPTFQKFVRTDATYLDFVRSTLDVFSSAGELKRISPHYAFASLLVDGTYDVTKWTASRNRLMQQYHLSDAALTAVTSLLHQIEKTVTKLKECRAE